MKSMMIMNHNWEKGQLRRKEEVTSSKLEVGSRSQKSGCIQSIQIQSSNAVAIPRLSWFSKSSSQSCKLGKF